MMQIAVVGYGYWGPNIVRQIKANPQFDLKYICEKKAENLEKAKELYSESVAFESDFKKVISDPDIDAVAIATETDSHFDLAKAALIAGKHIYVEKPLTRSVEQIKILAGIAAENRRIIHVNSIMIYHPAIKRIKELIDSGEMGEILYFDCSRSSFGLRENGDNSMWDLSVHDLSVIDYLSGGKKPVAVSAMGEKFYSNRESVTFLSLKFDGFLANVRSSWILPERERRMIIAGSKKMIVFDDAKKADKLIMLGSDSCSALEIENEDSLYNSLEHFRKCILGSSQSRSSTESAIRITEILEAADKQLKKEDIKCSL